MDKSILEYLFRLLDHFQSGAVPVSLKKRYLDCALTIFLPSPALNSKALLI